MPQTNAVTILLVEDDEGHAHLIRENLRQVGIHNDIITIADGLEAQDYLFCQGKYAEQQLPSSLLVLLDLNLPGRDGNLILTDMKKNENTRHIPVIILTTTDEGGEIKESYKQGCNLFITKPINYDQFSQSIRQLGLFLEIVQIPQGEN